MPYKFDDFPTCFSDDEVKIFVHVYKDTKCNMVKQYAQDDRFCFLVQDNDPEKEWFLTNCKNTILFEDCTCLPKKRHLLLKYARHHKLDRYFEIDDDMICIRSADKVEYTIKDGLTLLWEKFGKVDYPLVGLSHPGFCFGEMPKDGVDVYDNGMLFWVFHINLKTLPPDIQWRTEGLEDMPFSLDLWERGIPVKEIRHYCQLARWTIKNSRIGNVYQGFREKICFDMYKEYGNIVSFKENPRGGYPITRLTYTYRRIIREGGFKREFDEGILNAIKKCEETNYSDYDAILDAYKEFARVKESRRTGAYVKKGHKYAQPVESGLIRQLYADTMVAIISGNRPSISKRPTERRFAIQGGNWKIFSNNSEGYESKLEIVNVPDDFREYYRQNYAMSDFGMKVCLNRAYAMKYARDHGYRYLIQLDDNIHAMELKYITDSGETVEKSFADITPAMNLLTDILRYTNAGMSGMQLMAIKPTGLQHFLIEGYVYSVMCLDLEKTPYFWGDVEEDIQMRVQLAQKNIPTVQIVPLRYQKLGQLSKKDSSGNREDYEKEDFNRGEIMAKIHGEFYQRGVSKNVRNVLKGTRERDQEFFTHKVRKFKVGLHATDNERLKSALKTAISEINLQPDRRNRKTPQ